MISSFYIRTINGRFALTSVNTSVNSKLLVIYILPIEFIRQNI